MLLKWYYSSLVMWIRRSASATWTRRRVLRCWWSCWMNRQVTCWSRLCPHWSYILKHDGQLDMLPKLLLGPFKRSLVLPTMVGTKLVKEQDLFYRTDRVVRFHICIASVEMSIHISCCLKIWLLREKECWSWMGTTRRGSQRKAIPFILHLFNECGIVQVFHGDYCTMACASMRSFSSIILPSFVCWRWQGTEWPCFDLACQVGEGLLWLKLLSQPGPSPVQSKSRLGDTKLGQNQ